MKAVILNKNHQLNLVDAPIPKPEHGEVLVKVKACGICGSDLRYLEGENPWAQQTLGYVTENPDNMILGHEFSGEVVDAYDEEDRYLVGKRVAVLVYKTCGVCEFCRTGRENLCRNTQHIGHGAGWGKREFYPGGMSEYCCVWSTHVYPFADHISYEEASTLDFVSVALSAAKKASQVFAEDSMVIGSGPVGLIIAQFLHIMGARKVICVDILDHPLQVAKKTGADLIINSGREDVAGIVMENTQGNGVRNVFDTVGDVSTQRLAFSVLGGRGKLINIVCNTNVVEYRLKDFSGERSITSVANSPYPDFRESIRMLESGKIDVKPLITSVRPIEEYKAAFNSLLKREDSNEIKVILKPEKAIS